MNRAALGRRAHAALLLGLLLAMLAVPAFALAQSQTDLAGAINKAGRQRMLTQRVVKLYVQLGMDVATGQARIQLDESLALMAGQMADLESLARTPAARDALQRLQRARPELHALAQAKPTRAGALRLDAAAEEMLAAADRLAAQLEYGEPLGRLVNVSGRQRMMSQRLAKLYMLRAWGVALPRLATQIEASQEEFAAGLGRLLRAGENTAEIDRELYAVAVQWEWFKSALALEGIASYSLVVADASESMLRSLERVVDLYQRAAAPH